MPSREPSWNETLDTILTSRLRSVHTSLPGTIRSYDADEQTAQVELAVQLEGPGGAYERCPPLADVPVLHPGAWAAGDRCLVVFAEEDPSKWWATGGATVEAPAVQQRHGLHATCIVMVEGSAQFVALANLVDQRFGQLETALTAWQAALKAVSDVTPAAPVTAAILTAAVTALNGLLGVSWPESTAAAKVKAV